MLFFLQETGRMNAIVCSYVICNLQAKPLVHHPFDTSLNFMKYQITRKLSNTMIFEQGALLLVCYDSGMCEDYLLTKKKGNYNERMESL